MRIILTKLSDSHHLLECFREDGTLERADLDSKTFFFHDLLHYCIEQEAGLRHSFWSLIASGRRLSELSGKGAIQPPAGTIVQQESEVVLTELVVGALTGALRNDLPPDTVIEGLNNILSAQGRTLPYWLTPEFIERVRVRMRRLAGKWRALPYRGHLELSFP